MSSSISVEFYRFFLSIKEILYFLCVLNPIDHLRNKNQKKLASRRRIFNLEKF